MKFKILKRLFVTALVLLACFNFVACSGNEKLTQSESENSSQVDMSSSDTLVSQKDQPTYYYDAIEGAVIVEQDGTPHYSYYKKCESCNYVQDNIKINQSGGGMGTSTFTSSFLCPKCKTSQSVKIKQSVS